MGNRETKLAIRRPGEDLGGGFDQGGKDVDFLSGDFLWREIAIVVTEVVDCFGEVTAARFASHSINS